MKKYEKFCRWRHQSNQVFFEQPDDICVIRDLSTVEELDMALAMCRYLLQLVDELESLTPDGIASRMEAYGKQLRTTFITTYGYPPEDSATPYVPVTIEGPQDHDVYYAREWLKHLQIGFHNNCPTDGRMQACQLGMLFLHRRQVFMPKQLL